MTPALDQPIRQPCIAAIFGAGGDLTKRKLIPAFYNLARSKLLPQEFAVVGYGRTPIPDEEFRARMGADLKEFAGASFDPTIWSWLEPRLFYVAGDFKTSEDFARLGQALEKVDGQFNTGGNVLFYLATPPSFFNDIVQNLKSTGLSNEFDGKRFRRVVIEKPFGRDLESARHLNTELQKTLSEDQIYRIDHYLGKETVQNLMVFRFANCIFEPIWNHHYIDHVQITVAEELGVEQRGVYYEEAGALRDMISNHLLQLFALVAMEPPVSFEANAIRDEKAKVLRAIQPIRQEDVLNRAVRGQYGEGTIKGKGVPGYRLEPKVNSRSNVETFVALKLSVDNWRWVGVPFYIRTGKRLGKRISEVVIKFKRPPHQMFRETSVAKLSPNLIAIHVQPEEGISLQFGAKTPGPVVEIGDVKMAFHYKDYFGSAPSTGYETLLYEAMKGDATLFQRADNVEASWKVLQPIIDVWNALAPRDFPNYAAGSWGPKEADDLLARDGRSWRKTE